MIGMTRVLHKNYWNVMFILLQNYVKDDRKNKLKRVECHNMENKVIVTNLFKTCQDCD